VNSQKISLILIGVGSVLIAASVALLALVATDVIDNSSGGYSTIETGTTFGDPITAPTPGPSPTPTNRFDPGVDSEIARLRIPDAEIDAPVVVRGLDAQRVMQTPDNGTDVAWYDFTARPGFDGNAVFSGHVDYVSIGPAVFWNLKDLEQGDTIEVELADGTRYAYRVTSKNVYDAATAPVDQIVGPTADQVVTLITCNGTFNSATHQYDKRLVIRAERFA
jgi:LPXTG-site transpeptidase (sortase) family protein